jgi:DNA-binding transcriptional ArsR family regulator
MSKQYSLLFLWSKGSSTRRKIFKIIADEQAKGNPVYISEITTLFNNSLEGDETSVTNSSIRKHIRVLKEYNLIKPINEGGRPEYLELTEEGRGVLAKLKSKQ